MTEEHSFEANYKVPDDFPFPIFNGAVPGSQPKFLAVFFQGRYYLPGCTPPEIHLRWRYCEDLAAQFAASCLRSKEGKRAHMSQEEILAQYLARLIASEWTSPSEAMWIIKKAAEQLDWPPLSSSNTQE
ncbi:hypothetical protein [Massilia sp. KIM]|uniref:hypothetical protein n=1 Tax=Massilia sp. KIM TaxID=1955422 RepID=UPI001180DC38|nr:hypothetical protein [Massilia sp. KIM]